jgi:predicted DCC family thiol-disulfide oxidoreductase YuxK
VVDERGRLHVGFEAVLAIWRNSPSEKWKAWFFGLPVIRQICGLAYKLVARALYKWNRSKHHW